MIVSIGQPSYLPWLGYVERLALSDIHIVLDHVQLERRSFTSRNRIQTVHGWKWLSVPLKTKGHGFDLPINKVEIQNVTNWRKDHYQTILSSYNKSPYFVDHQSYFQQYYANEWHSLSELCQDFLFYLLRVFDLNTKIFFSSKMNSEFSKDKLILDLCKKVGGKTYLSGPFGRDYLNALDFLESEINLVYHDYAHPVYKQRFEPFQPYLSVIDLMFNCGEESKKILRTTETKELGRTNHAS